MATRRGFVLGALALCATRARGADDVWDRLRRGGLVMLLRHGPAAEARRAGARLREERVPIERVYTSPSPPCRETAMLAFGAGEDWDPLGPAFDSARMAEENAGHVRKRIASYTQRKLLGNVAMVTHAANIASLTKRAVEPGEIVVVRPDGCCGLRVVDQLKLA